jgi:hypothetical protein
MVDFPSGSSAGAIVDAWQEPITSLGEAGPDQGMGGRYLVVGPGQLASEKAADFVIHSPTANVLVGFRSLDADPAHANALAERFSMYPSGRRMEGEPTTFLRPHGRAWSQVPPRGLTYWKRLSDLLQREAAADNDLVMLSLLEPLGIGPGRPFAPTTRQRRLLEDAEQVGALMAQANAFYSRDADARYRPQTRWREVVSPGGVTTRPSRSQIDERAAYFYKASATSAGVLGGATHRDQSCLGAYHDVRGRALDGGRTYMLRVPPDPPARARWSLAIYDAEQRCLINNGRNVADRSSRDGLQRNDDGSIDICVGPATPRLQDTNWITTIPGRAWFAYFRLYEPLEPFFARRFELPDFVPVDGPD